SSVPSRRSGALRDRAASGAAMRGQGRRAGGGGTSYVSYLLFLPPGGFLEFPSPEIQAFADAEFLTVIRRTIKHAAFRQVCLRDVVPLEVVGVLVPFAVTELSGAAVAGRPQMSRDG